MTKIDPPTQWMIGKAVELYTSLPQCRWELGKDFAGLCDAIQAGGHIHDLLAELRHGEVRHIIHLFESSIFNRLP